MINCAIQMDGNVICNSNTYILHLREKYIFLSALLMSNFISDLIKDSLCRFQSIHIDKEELWLLAYLKWTLNTVTIIAFSIKYPCQFFYFCFFCKLANTKQLSTNELFWVVSQHYSHNIIVLIGSKNTTVASKSRAVPRWSNPYAHLLWGIAGVIPHGRKWERKREGASLRRWCWHEEVLLWIWLWHWKKDYGHAPTPSGLSNWNGTLKVIWSALYKDQLHSVPP